MFTTLKNAECEQSFESLQQQASQLRDDDVPRSLWITCTDLVMDRALERVREAVPAIVLRRFGNEVPADETEFCNELSAVNYAIEQLGVQEIVVCGHSLCSGIPAAGHDVLSSCRWHDMDGLRQGVRQREAMNDRSREHVVRQLRVLEEYPSVTRAMRWGSRSTDFSISPKAAFSLASIRCTAIS